VSGAGGQPDELALRNARGMPRIAWLSAVVLLVAVVLVVSHLGEERRLAELIAGARPGWLLVAAALQAGTYLCAAGVWMRALKRSPQRPRFASLVPLGLAKLFTDQAVPSAGMSGTFLVVRALTRRGVPRGDAVAAMLVGLAAFYLAYGLAVGGAGSLLWKLGELDTRLLAAATGLGIVAATLPAVLLGFGDRLTRRLPRALSKLPGAREVTAVLAELPSGRLVGLRLAAETIALQLAIFALDAATLGAMLEAVGAAAPPALVFASFVFASVVATIAWMPGGIGTFEGTCVLMLRSHGVPLEAALAATLLLRGFTFWLPMLPGLWIARREIRAVR